MGMRKKLRMRMRPGDEHEHEPVHEEDATNQAAASTQSGDEADVALSMESHLILASIVR